MVFFSSFCKELKLSPTSKSYEQWKRPTVPLYLDVYFFNWTNSEDFLDPTTKPILEEVGPYRFREYRDKKNINFDDNSTVSYRSLSTFHFDEDGSNGTLEDVITQLNIVAVGASAQALKMDYSKRKKVSMGLHLYEQTLAVSKAARELLFEGYEDDMVSMGRLGGIEGFEVEENPYDRIGWFYLVSTRATKATFFDSRKSFHFLAQRHRQAERNTQRAHWRSRYFYARRGSAVQLSRSQQTVLW